jgi:hypothetical protein
MEVFWKKGRELLYTLRGDSDYSSDSGSSTDSGDEPDSFNCGSSIWHSHRYEQ